MISDPNEIRDHLILLPQKRSLLICPLLGSLWLFPSKITLSWPPLMGKRSQCSSPDQLLVAANRQRVEDEIYVDVLTPHIPRRFLYSSSRALSNAFRAASALSNQLHDIQSTDFQISNLNLFFL